MDYFPTSPAHEALSRLAIAQDAVENYVVGYAQHGGLTWFIVDAPHDSNWLLINGNALAFSEMYIDKESIQKIALFPDGKTLSQMKSNTFEYFDWCKINLE